MGFWVSPRVPFCSHWHVHQALGTGTYNQYVLTTSEYSIQCELGVSEVNTAIIFLPPKLLMSSLI